MQEEKGLIGNDANVSVKPFSSSSFLMAHYLSKGDMPLAVTAFLKPEQDILNWRQKRYAKSLLATFSKTQKSYQHSIRRFPNKPQLLIREIKEAIGYNKKLSIIRKITHRINALERQPELNFEELNELQNLRYALNPAQEERDKAEFNLMWQKEKGNVIIEM